MRGESSPSFPRHRVVGGLLFEDQVGTFSYSFQWIGIWQEILTLISKVFIAIFHFFLTTRMGIRRGLGTFRSLRRGPLRRRCKRRSTWRLKTPHVKDSLPGGGILSSSFWSWDLLSSSRFQFPNDKDCQSTSLPQRHSPSQDIAVSSKDSHVLESPC